MFTLLGMYVFVLFEWFFLFSHVSDFRINVIYLQQSWLTVVAPVHPLLPMQAHYLISSL